MKDHMQLWSRRLTITAVTVLSALAASSVTAATAASATRRFPALGCRSQDGGFINTAAQFQGATPAPYTPATIFCPVTTDASYPANGASLVIQLTGYQGAAGLNTVQACRVYSGGGGGACGGSGTFPNGVYNIFVPQGEWQSAGATDYRYLFLTMYAGQTIFGYSFTE
jgi:hypothetical protein